MSSSTLAPSFSIVIPTYQRRTVVCAVVRALAKLEYSGLLELIVVVDGSTDGTAEAVAALECPFAVRIIDQHKGGAANARNRGAAAAKGEILLFLDDDMICEPDLVTVHSAMHCSGADAVIGDMPIHPGSPEWFLTAKKRQWAIWDREGRPVTPFDVFCGQLSVRRSVFESLGGFDDAFTAGSMFANEDIDFGVRLLQRFHVRHTPRAISHQVYVVSPRDYMRRARLIAAGDVRFATKHPRLSKELFERRGGSRRATRILYRPLSRIPFLPKVMSELAILVTDLGLNSSLHSSPQLARFFGAAHSISYWAAVSANGGMPEEDACEELHAG